MFKLNYIVVIVIGIIVAASTRVFSEDAKQAQREAMYRKYLEFPSYVKGGRVEPHWMVDGSSFWYVESAPKKTTIWRIDPRAEPGKRKTELFKTEQVRDQLAALLGDELPGEGLPFDSFRFQDKKEEVARFALGDDEFLLYRDTGRVERATLAALKRESYSTPQSIPQRWPWIRAKEILSTDGRWFASLRNFNLWLRSTEDDRWVQLTSDGIKDYEWEIAGETWVEGPGCLWSPDSLKLAVKRLDYRHLPKIPIVRFLERNESVDWEDYSKAGQPRVGTELYVFDVSSKCKVRIDTGGEVDQHVLLLGWKPDNSKLIFARTDRYSRKLEVLVADPSTGSSRVAYSELFDAPMMSNPSKHCRIVTTGDERLAFIWQSERDGWIHLYLYDLEGKLIRRLTKGNFPVVRVVEVDEERGWVYFLAHGDRQRPYDTHLYRVSLVDGKGSSKLTHDVGQHDIQFAPSKRFFLDTHSTRSRPPKVDLRLANGSLLETLSEASVDHREDIKWNPPEDFVVKASDGETDLYGVLYKPYDFDPSKKYPVIEYFGEPPQKFVGGTDRESSSVWPQAIAQLGFVTFMVHGRGPWSGAIRGRSFAEVCYGNFGRHEIPDHVAALKQLGENRPYMDLDRVGIRGQSFGGYFAIRALLQAPKHYHVGVAVAPVVEISDHWGNDVWLGPPEENSAAYEYASNLRLADQLAGKLLLVHGTGDKMVPFSHTMRLVDALMRVNKPYDLVVLPEWGHWLNETPEREEYRLEAYRRYFVEHLRP